MKSQLSPTSASADTYPSPANQHPSQLLNHTTDHRLTDPLIINYHLDHRSDILSPLQQSALVKEGLAGILVFVVKEGLAGILVFVVKEGLARILVFVPSYFDFVRLKNLFRLIDDLKFAAIYEYSTPSDIIAWTNNGLFTRQTKPHD
ncbi:rRNA-binding ribosome biosynthesis protein utp25 [Puccinia graminis f. sp. tritici]|uniref:U3 small nucleolar RNA-associated protein 25 n=1 Tax=Puccinia graminis f. sp. tritici TaxID=56615 RepID=A0A5B0R5S0_PUCGR|nr:rRNA-binding ribosome biosynthesis protein utp25 [Puccinia graminis f. sp. tritici]